MRHLFPGYFAKIEGGDLAVKFVTDSAAVKTPEAVLEDYRLSSSGRRFVEATNFVRAYVRDLPRLKTLLPSIGHLIWEDAAAAYASIVVEWIDGGYQSVRLAFRT